MEASEMEVEHSTPTTTSSSTSSFKRYALKNSIQTNFGDDYIFQITPKEDWSSMAVSLSNNAVKLYSPETGQYLGECRGHTSTINEIAFGDSSANSSSLLHSCSSDGTIRIWDSRTFQQVSVLHAGPSQEVFSFSFGGANNLLAGGCKAKVLLWDWRNKKQVACLEESHTEDVTQVRFIPGSQNKLLSASVDGLMCIFDTTGDINDDDHLESVSLLTVSLLSVLFIWDWKEENAIADFQEARSMASNGWTRDDIDYFIDCHSSSEDDRLWVIGATNAGTIGYFPVNYNNARAVGSPEAILEGGHAGIVRSIVPTSNLSKQYVSKSIFGWSGGEDGRLCCWLSDETSDVNRAWISSTLALKPTKTRKKVRHQPY
ncbi:hypothetical protein KSS87_010783 [Heliosperma pusillum]|nr:hypothetical protein KSS87_010783 [Heliosperma pusillum]